MVSLVLAMAWGLGATVAPAQTTSSLSMIEPETVYEVRGLIEPRVEATLSSQLAGRITQLPHRAGDSFSAGALLVRFDCALYQAELRKANAELRAARVKVRNNRELARLRSIGALEVALAEAEAEKAAAEVAHAGIYVQRCKIDAPYSGRVAERLVHEYESVKEGDELLRIIDQRSLELKLIVPSPWLAWLRKGSQFRFRVDETGATIDGAVASLGAQVDPVSQTVSVRADLPSRAGRVLAGMSGTALFAGPGTPLLMDTEPAFGGQAAGNGATDADGGSESWQELPGELPKPGRKAAPPGTP